ncbi:MAG TPA: DotU family type IV/VI secretion system protein [Bryobacteraceae bacterium]|jgi:type VI secretion system protein ImpK|nr:DotU family type IV/VI secretion system protein [Bryobacteraceae bacterium]
MSTARPIPAPPSDTKPQLDRLALLYESIFTAVVRLQSGRQQIQNSDAFRARMKDLLRDIGRAAGRRGYSGQDVQDANFAVVAFVDEVVLTAKDPQWAVKTLSEELFGLRSGGEVFFRKLDELRAQRDSQQLAQVLEVYYLCLLLGFEGRYSGGAKAELYLLMDNLRERLSRIQGYVPDFSPQGLPTEPLRAVQPALEPLPRHWKFLAVGSALFAVLCFLIFSMHLGSRAEETRAELQHLVR